MHKWETSQEKAVCNTYIEKVEILHVLHNKVALLMRRRSEPGTRNCHQIIFRRVWTIYIENVNQKMNFLYDSDEIEIRLPFYRFLFCWPLHSSFLFIECRWKVKWVKWKDCSKKFIETKSKLESATWSRYKQHNTTEFLVCVFSNSSITLA